MCTRKSDGIAISTNNYTEEEGSDDTEISYKCDGNGQYTIPRNPATNETILPKCLERRELKNNALII